MLTRTYTIPGLTVDEHTVTVPLDHFGDTPGELEVFARVYSLPGSAEKPYLVYLQGGPGFEAQRVTDPSGWVGRALREYNVSCWTSGAPGSPALWGLLTDISWVRAITRHRRRWRTT